MSPPQPPLRLMIYDNACVDEHGPFGLSHAWAAGGLLYWALGRLDACAGFGSWDEALTWLLEVQRGRAIGEIQFWGHGEWGGLWFDEELLKIDALSPGHATYEKFAALRERMLPDGKTLWWLRCCDTFGTEVGHEFARKWTRFFNCRAAGHTHHIMFWQSGLYELAPGEEPYWPQQEGVVEGLEHARPSFLGAPNTITCLHGAPLRIMNGAPLP